ncbi:MAG: phosphoribosylanthranilate isomerase [Candidatus Hadarchaeales archaeon]
MVKVKICGITRPEDGEMVSSLGADMVGVILVKGSRRCVSLERAGEIFKRVGENSMKVAVLMPENPSELEFVEEKLRPDYIQLHPSIPLEKIEMVKKSLSAGLIMVVPIPPENPDEAAIFGLAKDAAEIGDFVLLDTKGPEGGGTGKMHDWRISRKICASIKKPAFLAGGLNPMNLRKAIEAVRPHGVDVATGVEKEVGIKDPELVKEFIRIARESG